MEFKLKKLKKIIDTSYVYETEESFRDFIYNYMKESGMDRQQTDYLGKIKIIIEIIEE